MVVNLSERTIETVYAALTDSKKDIAKQILMARNERIKGILEYQMEKIEDALSVFEELVY